MLGSADRLARPAADISINHRRPKPRLVVVRPQAAASSGDRLRRFLNVAVALSALILLAPLMAGIALVVKLTSPGPVFYRQTRVGLDRRTGSGGNWRRRIDYGGKLFTIYKFRTMYQRPSGAEEQVWAQQNDPRVTPVGRVLRKYRLDELPQLINVLRGDMNVVGPRPEQPNIFLQLREQLDLYPLRQRLLPGITGWAQINQHYDCDVDSVKRKLEFDLEYASRISAAEDLKIMLRTFPVMVFGKGGW